MEIICPECQFSRQVDESKIPARSQVATCPKCQTKFQFRDLPDEEPAEPVVPQEQEPAEPRQAVLPTEEQDQPREALAPESPSEPEAPSEPGKQSDPVAPPTPEEVQSNFPALRGPGEDHRDELWEKLRKMRPPKEGEAKPEAKEKKPEPEQEKAPIPGWTGEFSDDFPDPMQGEVPEENETASPQVPPPFEQLDRYGFFHGLYMTIKLVLLSPRLFFSVMPVGGGLSKPLTFTILVTMIQGMAQYIWGMAGLSPASEGVEAVGGMTGTATALLMLLIMPAVIAMGQFFITGIYHLLLILMRADNKGFEGTFRALAYANAPIVLGLFPMPLMEIEVGWMFIAAFWGLFLTIIGLKNIHKTSYAKVIPVALIPLLLAMILGLMVFQGQMPTV